MARLSTKRSWLHDAGARYRTGPDGPYSNSRFLKVLEYVFYPKGLPKDGIMRLTAPQLAFAELGVGFPAVLSLHSEQSGARCMTYCLMSAMWTGLHATRLRATRLHLCNIGHQWAQLARATSCLPACRCTGWCCSRKHNTRRVTPATAREGCGMRNSWQRRRKASTASAWSSRPAAAAKTRARRGRRRRKGRRARMRGKRRSTVQGRHLMRCSGVRERAGNVQPGQTKQHLLSVCRFWQRNRSRDPHS